MTVGPSLRPPRAGDPIALGFAYVKRQSAEYQASMWNQVLADDPVLGPQSGFEVGVGVRMDGRYPLVWVARRGRLAPPDHGKADRLDEESP